MVQCSLSPQYTYVWQLSLCGISTSLEPKVHVTLNFPEIDDILKGKYFVACKSYFKVVIIVWHFCGHICTICEPLFAGSKGTIEFI
jgi:hypothetical protein